MFDADIDVRCKSLVTRCGSEYLMLTCFRICSRIMVTSHGTLMNTL